MKRFGCFAFVLLGVALLGCIVLAAFLPRQAGAVAVVVTPWPWDYPTPAPYPTQVVYPTACAPARGTATPICGVVAVSAGSMPGASGYEMAQFVALMFGLGFIGVAILVGQFVGGRR